MKSITIRADIPDDAEDRKALVTNGLESGITRFILRKGDERFEDLGLMDAVYFDKGVPCTEGFASVTIDTPEAQSKALALAGKAKSVMVETSDWTIIPLENMIAKFRDSGTEILACARTRDEAELFLTTMEKGVDGIVVCTDDPLSISKFKDLVKESDDEKLIPIKVTSVKPVEMGDRVCIDTCTMMEPGEGMLIGSYSNCLFLIQSESEENGYVASRPFRVNAGAVHSYIEVPGGGTRYLSEIKSGDPVLICGRDGTTRVASVGRCKVEVRPLLMLTATDGKKEYSVMLQNAETIKVVTPNGAVSVTKIKKGDEVLAKIETGGRHFGMAVEETIAEK